MPPYIEFALIAFIIVALVVVVVVCSHPDNEPAHGWFDDHDKPRKEVTTKRETSAPPRSFAEPLTEAQLICDTTCWPEPYTAKERERLLELATPSTEFKAPLHIVSTPYPEEHVHCYRWTPTGLRHEGTKPISEVALEEPEQA